MSARMPQKRGRACEACSKIKIRCSLGQASEDAAPPCERCVRLNKECILSAPKRQKDRVAELEAQVAQLTRLLESQHIQVPSVSPATASQSNQDESPTPAQMANASGTATKKRRLESDGETPQSSVSSPGTQNPEISDIQRLDRVLSYELQQRTLTRYVTEIAPLFPAVPAPADCSLPEMRVNRPTLLMAFLYAASAGFLSLDTQEDVAQILLNALSARAITHGEETLELIQAIQIACLWYRSPKHHRRAAVYQLIDIASAMANGLSAGGPLAPPTQGLTLDECPDTGSYESVEGWRAWLGCHVLSVSMSIFMRKPMTATWTEQHEQARLMLQYSPLNADSDRWLAQYIRAERLCEEVSEQVDLTNTSFYRDVADPATRNRVQTCRNKILNWKMGVPQSLRSPLILFWEHVATAYMHEPVLHTVTNKESFTAPYLAERLSLTDFPTPVVTQDHITAVYELTAAVQAVLDIFINYDTKSLVASPSLVYAARAAYALYVLAKLYIAVTAPGNTLGTILDASILALPEYADRLATCGSRIRALDERCGPARIMHCAPAIKDWYLNYTQFLSSNAALAQSIQVSNDNVAETQITLPPLQDTTNSFSSIPPDWENLLMFGDSSTDYGFDQLFAEPIPLQLEQPMFANTIPAAFATK
ncbi:hypothetical protein CKM354_000400600 [Cercospora kikuchii]|uniref:Zn(2)-C6 fungal-type domain-containing protein n=1 Tax=Cercospora kikuchii TaxID=84275 RepID=A0A9P3CLK6_9PEZI|nr:uncharacterized protein CKM354_000400600 [Cercospora kikuchii]GIZ40678.1 hypothetical protein CKM354_000400600 [Cercospora kikuchii]